jgi:hypothetical protein
MKVGGGGLRDIENILRRRELKGRI